MSVPQILCSHPWYAYISPSSPVFGSQWPHASTWSTSSRELLPGSPPKALSAQWWECSCALQDQGDNWFQRYQSLAIARIPAATFFHTCGYSPALTKAIARVVLCPCWSLCWWWVLQPLIVVPGVPALAECLLSKSLKCVPEFLWLGTVGWSGCPPFPRWIGLLGQTGYLTLPESGESGRRYGVAHSVRAPSKWPYSSWPAPT